MTSYLLLYLHHGARLFGHGKDIRGFKLSPFGLLPHEIADLNARRAAEARARSDAARRARHQSYDGASVRFATGAVR